VQFQPPYVTNKHHNICIVVAHNLGPPLSLPSIGGRGVFFAQCFFFFFPRCRDLIAPSIPQFFKFIIAQSYISQLTRTHWAASATKPKIIWLCIVFHNGQDPVHYGVSWLHCISSATGLYSSPALLLDLVSKLIALREAWTSKSLVEFKN
jgi:hypothetical protein